MTTKQLREYALLLRRWNAFELGGPARPRCCAQAASLCPSNLDRGGATFDPGEFAQPLHESGDPVVLNRSGYRAQGPDGWQSRRVLRPRRERPSGHCAAEQRNEIASFHSQPPTSDFTSAPLSNSMGNPITSTVSLCRQKSRV